MEWLFPAAAAGFGLLWGSFLNVAIHRLPRIDLAGLRRHTPHTLLYLAYPLSFCPRCEARIPPWHNIPLLSYLLLRGTSCCCGRRISAMYPAVEAAGALIALAALFFTGNPLNAVFAAVFLSILLVNAVIDWQRLYLLDILTYPLLWLGLVANIDARFALLPDAIYGAVGGYLSLALFAGAVSYIMRRRAMGMGDYKLFAALGAWLGWQALPLVLFIAALLGIALAAGRRLARGRGGRQLPFGPCLSAAGALMLLFGDDIMLAYWQFISR